MLWHSNWVVKRNSQPEKRKRKQNQKGRVGGRKTFKHPATLEHHLKWINTGNVCFYCWLRYLSSKLVSKLSLHFKHNPLRCCRRGFSGTCQTLHVTSWLMVATNLLNHLVRLIFPPLRFPKSRGCVKAPKVLFHYKGRHKALLLISIYVIPNQRHFLSGMRIDASAPMLKCRKSFEWLKSFLFLGDLFVWIIRQSPD